MNNYTYHKTYCLLLIFVAMTRLQSLLYTSGPVSLKERLLYTLNKLFVKQVKSFYLLLDQDPFIFLCSFHNIMYIKFTSLQDISIKVMQLSHSLFPSQVILFRVEFICIFSSLSKTGPSLITLVPNSLLLSLSPSSLRAQASQSGLYSVIIKYLNIYYGIN